MDIHGLSQINFGLIILGIKTANMYDPDVFVSPYDEAVEYLKKHPSKTVDDTMNLMAPSDFDAAKHAALSVNGLGKTHDWMRDLTKAYKAYKLGDALRKAGERYKKNEPVDILPLQGQIQSLVNEELSSGLTKLKDIDYKNFQPFQDSGWDVIDNIFGGIPASGLMVVFGETGVGKSFWLSKLMDCFLRKHKKKTGATYTLEMTSEEYAQRSVSMYPDLFKSSDRFYISGNARTIDEIVAEVSSKRLDIVGIDFVDWLVRDKQGGEGAYAYVYMTCVELARILKIPVVMLAQPNREGYKYPKFLTKTDIRWSGAAEFSAWQLIGLQAVNGLGFEDTKYPTFDEEHFYMIGLKQRGGWPKQEGPGAIILKPQKGKGKWEGEVIKNKIWRPADYSSSQVIGSRKEHGSDRNKNNRRR